MKNKIILAYTDGSASVQGKSKGRGGFGTYFPDFYGSQRAFSDGFLETKTGAMEVSALYYAIKAMPKRSTEKVVLRVYSDSEYVVKSFTENRLERWIQAGWRNTSGKVKNQEKWAAIVNALNCRGYLTLDMIHIRSHQVEKEKDPIKKANLLKDPHIIGNMVADVLADYKRHTKLRDDDRLV